MRAHACNRCVRPQMPTGQPTCTCAAPCLSPVCDQRPRPARETIRVMRAADAKENRMQRFSPPRLDHNVDVHQHCTRQRELGGTAVVAMAERYEATRTQGDEPRNRESASASSCSERTATERGARKEPTRPPSAALRRPGARFMKPHRLQKRSASQGTKRPKRGRPVHAVRWLVRLLSRAWSPPNE